MSDIVRPTYETDIIPDDLQMPAQILFSKIEADPVTAQASLDILATNPNISVDDKERSTEIIAAIGQQGLDHVLSFHTILANGLDARVLELDDTTKNAAYEDPRHVSARNNFLNTTHKSDEFRKQHRIRLAAIELSHFAHRTSVFQSAAKTAQPALSDTA
jgi:hypothetical protein